MRWSFSTAPFFFLDLDDDDFLPPPACGVGVVDRDRTGGEIAVGVGAGLCSASEMLVVPGVVVRMLSREKSPVRVFVDDEDAMVCVVSWSVVGLSVSDFARSAGSATICPTADSIGPKSL